MLKIFPIPGLEGYGANIDGQIWSDRSKRFLKQHLNKAGYWRFRTVYGNRYTHREVCAAFNGPCPEGHQASHLDGNSTNCKADNLIWETPKENTNRKYKHGTMFVPHKLTKKELQSLIEDSKTKKFTQTQLAKKYNITQSRVSGIQCEHNIERRQGCRKLTFEQEDEILTLVSQGLSQAKIGTIYNVSASAIFRLIKRRTN